MRFGDWVKYHEKVETEVAFKKLNSTPIKDLIGATDMDLFLVVKNSLDKIDLWSNFFYHLHNGFPDSKNDVLYDAYKENIITKEKDLPIVHIRGIEDKCLIYHYPILHENQKDKYDHALIDNTLESKIQFLKIWYIDKYFSPHVPVAIHDFINNGLSKINAEREVKKDKKVEGVKHDKDKLRFDLLSPYALEEIVKVLTFGAKKYGDRNWEKGLTYSQLVAALYRHLNKFQQGKDVDEESNCQHMASIAFCAMAILHFQATNQNHLDDRVKL